MTTAIAAQPPTEEGLRRRLSPRQLTMIAIGGAIGVGLFFGSAEAISTAGPSVLISYAIAGVIVFLVLRALGELALYRPTAGSFATYADEFVGPLAGYLTGWTYWLMWVTTVMAELTAIGIYTEYFIPGIPQWLPGLLAIAVLLAANLVSVRVFGETEFWFAMIKVVAIIAFVLIGITITLVGVGALGDQAAASNLWDHGGFFPKGIDGTLLSLGIVTYAFLGVEMIGVTAGEARDPERVLPSAINSVAYRILLFYIGAILVVLMLIPWNDVNDKESPFVLAFASIGIGAAAAIINGVVLTSALSSCNSGLFTTGRMTHSMAYSGRAPRRLGGLTRRHVPARALAFSTVALVVGVVINVLVPAEAFNWITSVATVAVLWIWAMIVISHLGYRARVRRGALADDRRFRMPGSPWTNWVVLGFVALVGVLQAIDDDRRVSIYAGAVWLALLLVGWAVIKRRSARAPAGA
jgi:amino acid transporter, AAT family